MAFLSVGLVELVGVDVGIDDPGLGRQAAIVAAAIHNVVRRMLGACA